MARKKFIPNGDLDFLTMAKNFVRPILADPQRYEIAADDAAAASASVARFEETLRACRPGERSPAGTIRKDEARAEAEKIIRRLAHGVRASVRVDSASKIILGISPRREKAKLLPCPQEPPRLRFLRALHEGSGATPMHELAFSTPDMRHTRPEGAVRLELFVDLVGPDEPIPTHPGANTGGRPWYLRSYTRSPIKLIPPMPRVAMRVLYWGRWADSLGNTGPWSATAAGWIEGGSHKWLPGGAGSGRVIGNALVSAQLLEDATGRAAPAAREAKYSVAVLDAQYQSYHPQGIEASETAALPEPETRPAREIRQLEGPAEAESEAA